MVSTPAACVAFHRKEERRDVRGATRLEVVVERGPAAAAPLPNSLHWAGCWCMNEADPWLSWLRTRAHSHAAQHDTERAVWWH